MVISLESQSLTGTPQRSWPASMESGSVSGIGSGLHPARQYQPSTGPVKGSKILWPGRHRIRSTCTHAGLPHGQSILEFPAGYSWAEIGSRLGITRQAAQQRWGRPNRRHRTLGTAQRESMPPGLCPLRARWTGERRCFKATHGEPRTWPDPGRGSSGGCGPQPPSWCSTQMCRPTGSARRCCC
jgi:hypothetical protein